MLYIKFEIKDTTKFQDFQKVYAAIAPLKETEEQRPLDFWLDLIPDYAKRFLRMKHTDNPNSNFKKMVQYLQQDLEVQFDGLQELGKGMGKMEFSTGNYPYGGMDRLLVFLKSFDCVAVEIYNGFAVNTVTWTSKFGFDCEVNIDKVKEIVALFNQKADLYQDKYMDVGEYHAHLDLFCKEVLAQNAAILEIACGPGNITQYLLSQRPDFAILGTDLSENMIALAKANNPQATFEMMDMRAIGQIQGPFAGVLCGFGLPYLSKEEAKTLIASVSKLLLPGGVFYLSTMEGAEHQSGYLTPSGGGSERMYTYYHQADFLVATLEEYGFAMIYQGRQANVPQSGGSGMDLILLARKN